MNDCEKFLANPKINPKTNRKIKATGAVYKKLVKECGNPRSRTPVRKPKSRSRSKTPVRRRKTKSRSPVRFEWETYEDLRGWSPRSKAEIIRERYAKQKSRSRSKTPVRRKQKSRSPDKGFDDFMKMKQTLFKPKKPSPVKSKSPSPCDKLLKKYGITRKEYQEIFDACGSSHFY